MAGRDRAAPHSQVQDGPGRRGAHRVPHPGDDGGARGAASARVHALALRLRLVGQPDLPAHQGGVPGGGSGGGVLWSLVPGGDGAGPHGSWRDAAGSDGGRTVERTLECPRDTPKSRKPAAGRSRGSSGGREHENQQLIDCTVPFRQRIRQMGAPVEPDLQAERLASGPRPDGQSFMFHEEMALPSSAHCRRDRRGHRQLGTRNGEA